MDDHRLILGVAYSCRLIDEAIVFSCHGNRPPAHYSDIGRMKGLAGM